MRMQQEHDEEKQQMRKQMEQFRGQCERGMADEKAHMMRQADEWRAELERMEQEKVGMRAQIEAVRYELEAEMDRRNPEKSDMKKQMGD